MGQHSREAAVPNYHMLLNMPTVLCMRVLHGLQGGVACCVAEPCCLRMPRCLLHAHAMCMLLPVHAAAQVHGQRASSSMNSSCSLSQCVFVCLCATVPRQLALSVHTGFPHARPRQLHENLGILRPLTHMHTHACMQVRWCRSSSTTRMLLSTNDKTIKLWRYAADGALLCHRKRSRRGQLAGTHGCMCEGGEACP